MNGKKFWTGYTLSQSEVTHRKLSLFIMFCIFKINDMCLTEERKIDPHWTRKWKNWWLLSIFLSGQYNFNHNDLGVRRFIPYGLTSSPPCGDVLNTEVCSCIFWNHVLQNDIMSSVALSFFYIWRQHVLLLKSNKKALYGGTKTAKSTQISTSDHDVRVCGFLDKI